MYIDNMPVVCLDCSHEWTCEIIQDAPLSVVIAGWKSLYCSKCGARWKRLAFRLVDPPPVDKVQS